MDYISLEDIKDKLDFFSKMYDAVRLVDPLKKRVLDYRNSALVSTQEICYDYWGSGVICDNCISVRSHNENRSFVKLEKSKDSVLLVTAIPIRYSSSSAVLELFKNATDTMLVGTGEYNKGEMLAHFVRDLSAVIVKDPLTSLYNRRFLDERLPAEIINALLKNQPLSVCFIDVDNFKSINDLYGHETGDYALKAVSDAIIKNIRFQKDWAARYGGDEFLVFLNNTDEEQAEVIARRIQEDVSQIPVNPEEESLHLSISFGIGTMNNEPMTVTELIRQADEKMYQSKKEKNSRI